MTGGFELVPLSEKWRQWAREIIAERWGSTVVITRGKAHDTSRLPGFVALANGQAAGLATYCLAGGDCEMVSLDSLLERRGIGTVLVRAVEEAARKAGSARLWLITTNDNLAAVSFYQRRGFRIAAIHLNALQESRRLKPGIPLRGIHGIPITDEIELEMPL